MKHTYLNSKIGILIFALLLIIFSSETLNAQSLTEKLGGIKTDFIFMNEGEVLPVTDQIIIRRGEHAKSYGSESGYGYGYEPLYLEFASKQPLKEIDLKWKSYKVSFFDSEDKLLGSVIFDLREMKLSNSNKIDLYIYTVNLEKIPVILLEKTKTIHINLDGLPKKKKR